MIAAEVTISSADFGQLEPMVTASESELAAAQVFDAPEVVLADAGYWHTEQIERLTGRGQVVLIAPDAGKRKGARPGWDGALYAFMRRVLATDHGGALYRRRNVMIEPVFANTKFNRRIDRFQRRGRSACRSEWRLIAATHNLLKLHRHELGLATAWSLPGPPAVHSFWKVCSRSTQIAAVRLLCSTAPSDPGVCWTIARRSLARAEGGALDPWTVKSSMRHDCDRHAMRRIGGRRAA